MEYSGSLIPSPEHIGSDGSSRKIKHKRNINLFCCQTLAPFLFLSGITMAFKRELKVENRIDSITLLNEQLARITWRKQHDKMQKNKE